MKILDIKFLIIAAGICVFSGCDDSDSDSVLGCTNDSADNYNSAATEDDGSCIIYGCMDEAAINYNPDANDDCGSCCEYEGEVLGCMNENACNYNENATIDDGSCQIPLDNPIEIISYDAYVTGVVGEELVSHIYIRNAACEEMILDASQSGVHPSIGQAKFCLGVICYEWGETEAAVTLSMESFEEGDLFQGYFKSDNPVVHEVTYTIFTDAGSQVMAEDVEVIVTFEVTE